MYTRRVEIQGMPHTPVPCHRYCPQLACLKQKSSVNSGLCCLFFSPDEAIWCNNSRRGDQRFHFLGLHARWHKCHCRNLPSVRKIWYIPNITHTFAGPTLTKCFSFSVKARCCHIFSAKNVCLVHGSFNWITQ